MMVRKDPPAAAAPAAQSVVDIISQVAQEKGIPVGLALAIAKWESGLDPNNIGDNGHSVGLFQLNDQGEGSGLSVQERQDPRRNAEIALSEVAKVYQREPNASWGQIATDAQRPASYTFPAYHASVNAAQAQYQTADPTTVVAAYKSGAPVTATAPTGGATGADVAAGTTPATGPADQLAETFGYSSAFFNSDPSLKKLIDKYKALPLDAAGNVPTKTLALFKAELTATPWYQQHTLNQRSWIQLQTADPAEATHQLLGVQQQLAQQARQMGLNLPPGQLHEMANNALSMYGQNVPASVVNDMLGAQVKYKGTGTYTGQVGSDVTALKNLAQSYNVPLSDATMQAWLRNIVQNGVDPTSYTDFLKNQAASAYPTLKPQFDQGLNFTQATDTYRNDAANTLNIDPATVDFTQPKWMKALTQIDPTTGARTAMSRDQWMTTLRTDPTYGYQNTHQAQNTAAQLASTIASKWGLQNG